MLRKVEPGAWPCPHAGCTRAFDSNEALGFHVKRVHRVKPELQHLIDGACKLEPAGGQLVCSNSSGGLPDGPNTSTFCSAVFLPPLDGPSAAKSLAATLSWWELDERVPQTVKQRQKEDVEEIFQDKMQKLQLFLRQYINDNWGAQAPPQIDLGQFPEAQRFWPGELETLAREKTYCKHAFGVVEPEMFHLGDSELQLVDDAGNVIQVIHSNDVAAVFPFAPQLRSLFTNGDLYHVMQEFRTKAKVASVEDAKICSHFDGDEWKTNPFVTQHKDAYSLSWYCDEQIPLGSTKGRSCSSTTPCWTWGQFIAARMRPYFPPTWCLMIT